MESKDKIKPDNKRNIREKKEEVKLMNVLLSIKPRFVEKILEGEKRFEFRKGIFKQDVAKRWCGTIYVKKGRF